MFFEYAKYLIESNQVALPLIILLVSAVIIFLFLYRKRLPFDEKVTNIEIGIGTVIAIVLLCVQIGIYGGWKDKVSFAEELNTKVEQGYEIDVYVSPDLYYVLEDPVVFTYREVEAWNARVDEERMAILLDAEY